MQSFIVLGLVPGTNIQLNFNFWLYVTVLLLITPVLRTVWRRRDVARSYIIALIISRVIARYQVPA
jgi:hypothetical protein